jgi:hypothetical protein
MKKSDTISMNSDSVPLELVARLAAMPSRRRRLSSISRIRIFAIAMLLHCRILMTDS